MKQKNRVIFYLHNGVHLLDLAGAVQTFQEAGDFEQPYQLVFVSGTRGPTSSAGLPFQQLPHYSSVAPTEGELLIVAGFDLRELHAVATPDMAQNTPTLRTAADQHATATAQRNPTTDQHTAADQQATSAPQSTEATAPPLHTWLRSAAENGATIASVCTAAFLLAEAGLLDGRECTTHWRHTQRLQRDYPRLLVQTDRLYVKAGHIYTSAGVTTGIDLALFLLEERHGAELAFKVAREMVVYIRRDGAASQESIYLQYRSHIHNDIHIIQDWIIQNIHKKIKIEDLAVLIHTSSRNLTRLFKHATGLTIGQYIEKLRVEKAVHLLHRQAKIASIPRECGLQSANQLRSLVKKHTGRLPKELAR
jgi:transcriptional regulator GlxA family with amidase domain